MSTNKELSEKIFRNRENGITHLPYDKELTFFDAVRNGDEETVKAVMLPLSNENLGNLSDNPVRNLKYHLIITTALITRFCVESGMPSETAYTLSDIYIKQLDRITAESEITALHKTLVFDFTKRMRELSRETVFSKSVILAMNYIEKHLHEKISLDDLSQQLKLNKTYICRLFKNETGCTVGDYIKSLKIKSAQNMLIHSDIPAGEIGEYLAFASQSYFIKVFREETGYTPAEYRNKFFGRHYNNI